MDPRRLLPYLIVFTVCAVLGTTAVVVVAKRDRDSSAPTPSSRARAVADDPREVLADWDARRAAAWADGDVEALSALYVDGSATGRVDARMLTAYVDRGLRVEGLTTQVLAWEVLSQEPDSFTVTVTDRVVAGTIVGESVRQALPRDRATTRTLVLRREGGRWLVARVRDQVRDQAGDQDRAVESTSRASTSSKS